ncbi:hypothetical protein Rhein_2815 [Rheinheimera sp. A13L]|uniref:hypothetical protein n=1 Tax=Rheinheimera sp. A13L TaxID=506534 RepID=UPI0002124D93|nr:hypothetical protein [Rheinheimera sp. A13L]EGM77117.1 hypothetical protein Rhein_2815 [Rheinheimera sp. A13L]
MADDIVDTNFKEAFSDIQLQQSLLYEQALIAKELQSNQDVIPLSYNPNATVLHIPKIDNRSVITITLAPAHNRTRQLIFGAFNAAAHLYLVTDNFPEGRKNVLLYCRRLWRYLDIIDLTDENRVTWLKDYEAWRVSENGVKTQSTGLSAIKLMIQDALALSAFTETLSDYEREYLVTLANTSAAPQDEANAVNLNQWFSQHTWLRRDEIGIGHELYTRLGSPKALMNSFRITIENALLYLQTCKDALIDGFRLAGITPKDIPVLVEAASGDGKSKQYYYTIVSAKAEMLNRLRQKLVQLTDDTPHLKSALELVVFAEVRPQFRRDILDKLLTNQPIFATSRNQTAGFFTAKQNVGLFDTDFLRQLALHTVSHPDNDVVPVSLAESLLFSYLMAYQTVQGSDISKLTLRDFKFVKRINGVITHIESDYFKGRARHNAHQVETLKTKDDIGKAVLRYIKDVTALREQDKPLTPVIKKEICSPCNATGLLCLACTDTALWHVISEKHQTQRVAPVFPRAIHAMLYNGISRNSPRKAKAPCEGVLPYDFFSFSHIKTSAVYAGSENFDPASLINQRSHTNETEREHYLVEMNQEWQNNCGRVTRAVMRDLYVNVFTASESDKQLFESEFTKAIEHIKTRANDVLACLKVVTEQTSGHVDELGFVSTGAQVEDDLPDTIYIQDSPETVLKLKHFLAQLQEKHTLLRECAPEFLLFTALPTAEWIESLFDNKHFSKTSLKYGQDMYEKYRSHLPPHFTAQLS